MVFFLHYKFVDKYIYLRQQKLETLSLEYSQNMHFSSYLYEWAECTDIKLDFTNSKLNSGEVCIHWKETGHLLTLGKPGISLSINVATWYWSIFVSSAIMWAAAPFSSFLRRLPFAFTTSDSLWVKSSWKKIYNTCKLGHLMANLSTSRTVKYKYHPFRVI